MSYERTSAMIARYIASGTATSGGILWRLQRRLEQCAVEELVGIINTLEAQSRRLWRQRELAEGKVRDSLTERHSIVYDLLQQSRASYRRQVGHARAVEEGIAQ